jgi:hypothetical protein
MILDNFLNIVVMMDELERGFQMNQNFQDNKQYFRYQRIKGTTHRRVLILVSTTT